MRNLYSNLCKPLFIHNNENTFFLYSMPIFTANTNLNTLVKLEVVKLKVEVDSG